MPAVQVVWVLVSPFAYCLGLTSRDYSFWCECVLCRGDVGSLTRVGSMTIGYFSPPSERVFLWFWQWSWDCFLVAHMCFKGAMAVKSILVG